MHRCFEPGNPKVTRQRFLRFAGLTIFMLLPHIQAVAQTADTPETTAEHFQDFTHAVVSPGTILIPGTSAAFSQFVSKPAGFAGGAEGYGQHYGVALADNVSGKFIRDFGFPALLRQNVKYVPDQAKAGAWHRVGHACMHSVILGPDDRRLNSSGMPASFASAGLSNLYQPQEQKTWSATFQRTGTNAAGYLLGDLASEFAPEICAIRKKLRLGFGCK